MILLNCSLNLAVDIATILSSVFALATLIIAMIGVKWVYNIRQHQHEASYGFYANLLTYFDMLELFLKTGEEMSPWLIVLGKNKDEILKLEQKGYIEEADKCAIIAQKILDFLAKAQNQVPPNKKEEEIWEQKLNVLRKNLVKIAYYDLSAYADWGETSRQETFNGFVEAINYISEEIKRYKFKDKSETNEPKKV